MALLNPFCDLTNLFLSTSNDGTADKKLWEEIWGCVNYLKIPYETVMHDMPVYVRKFWIMKHNETVSNENKTNAAGGNASTIDGQAINSYARLEQRNRNTPK